MGTFEDHMIDRNEKIAATDALCDDLRALCTDQGTALATARAMTPGESVSLYGGCGGLTYTDEAESIVAQIRVQWGGHWCEADLVLGMTDNGLGAAIFLHDDREHGEAPAGLEFGFYLDRDSDPRRTMLQTDMEWIESQLAIPARITGNALYLLGWKSI